MAPRYLIANDFGATDGLVSYSPHWVLGFARYANPLTFDPTKGEGGASVTDDVSFAYAERDPLVVDDLGDCVGVTISAQKSAHTMSMQASFADSGVKYLNELLPGDWVVAFMVYSEDELRRISGRLLAREQVNTWNSGLKFLGRVQGIQKQVNVAPDGKRISVYSLTCVAFGEFDSTVMYYPEMAMADNGALASQERFGLKVSRLVRGDESDEKGAVNPNKIIPALMEVIFGKGSWGDQTFRDRPLTPNQAYIVPETICRWMGVGSPFGKFSDIVRVLVGIQKFSQAAKTSAPGDAANELPGDSASPSAYGSLFWPDGTWRGDDGYHTAFELTGSFPTEMVPQATTTPWAFITNYVAMPVNEALVTLRPDDNGFIVPMLTVRQSPYTSEVGKSFDLKAYQFEQSLSAEERRAESTSSANFETLESNTLTGIAAPSSTANAFRTRPTTRFLELPRWVIPDEILSESNIGRSDMLRQNLVFVHGTGPGAPMNDYDQFVNAGPVTDKLDILRNGIRPYMPSVNCFLRDLIMLPTAWRAIMADIVMGQHLTLSGSLTVQGIRSPIAPGDNAEFQGVVYHVEGFTHSCGIDSSGNRNFVTRLTLARGTVDVTASMNLSNRTDRTNSFPNLNATDPDGPPVGVSMDH